MKNSADEKQTNADATFGQQLAPFEGVPEMFDRLRQRAYKLNPEVEFYLITCGMVEIARHNCIAAFFKAMWGCEFHYGEDGGVHIPLNQVIYVGDGAYDIPCFFVLNQEQGIVIRVYKKQPPAEWREVANISQSQRVANLAPADYQEDSELLQSLMLAVESICKQIALHQLSIGE